MVRLSLRESNGKDRVLPTLYGDNYFWLLPGENRVLADEPSAALDRDRGRVVMGLLSEPGNDRG